MFRLRVLGGFALEGPPEAPAPALPQQRADAVLAVLAVCGSLGCTRERLIALLWPDSDEVRARRSLRDTLHIIRAALGPGAVLAPGEMLRLDETVVASDVRAFTTALAAGSHQDAVHAYGGALLEGFHVDGAPEFERWLDGERTRLGREYAEALVWLAEQAERDGAWGPAAGWWARAEEHDPLNSQVALRHAEALASVGDRANAVKVVEAHMRRLRDELEMAPDQEILEALERLRRGNGGRQWRWRPPSAADTTPAPASPAMRARVAPAHTPWASRMAGLAVVLLLAAATVTGAYRLRMRTPPRRHPRTAIAVLPFQYLGADSTKSYLAAGLHDELLAELQGVAALQVTGRSSVLGYARGSKTIREIADELAVGSIVEGSVQVVGDRLRVNVQLIDPVTQTHLWANRYDRPLGDVLAVQADIAQRIVEGLGARITSSEASALAEAPTRTADAYQDYLRGLAALRGSSSRLEYLQVAQRLFEDALALDPGFALAHAALSEVHGRIAWVGYDVSPQRRAWQHAEAEAALRLAPDLPQAHAAMGLYYESRTDHWSLGDSRRALEEYRLALRTAPNDPLLWSRIATAEKDLGQWDRMDSAFRRAAQLDPGDLNLQSNRSSTYWFLRRYAEAVRMCHDDDTLCRGWIYAAWKGELDSIDVVWARMDRATKSSWYQLGTWAQYLLWRREPDSLLALLRDTREPVVDPVNQYRPTALYAAWAHQLKGDTAAARSSFDAAVVLLDSAVRARPTDVQVHGSRGLALAGLGRRSDALREAQWLAESARAATPWGRAILGTERALVLAQIPEPDSALAQLDRLLAGPAWLVSVPLLRLDPRWDPIRRDPRFGGLLTKYSSAL